MTGASEGPKHHYKSLHRDISASRVQIKNNSGRDSLQFLFQAAIAEEPSGNPNRVTGWVTVFHIHAEGQLLEETCYVQDGTRRQLQQQWRKDQPAEYLQIVGSPWVFLLCRVYFMPLPRRVRGNMLSGYWSISLSVPAKFVSTISLEQRIILSGAVKNDMWMI